MSELLSHAEFRDALENAMKGTMAKDASFSRAWANGKLQRHHFAAWAENHYHYVGPFADYLGYMYANTPDHAADAKDFLLQNMYEEELSDVRHTDLLIRFAEACGGTRERVMDRNNAMPFTRALQGWLLRHRRPRALRRRDGRPHRRPRVAGADDLPRAVPDAARRSTASPRTRPSSSTSTSPRTRSTASAATRSCSTTPTRPSCSSAASTW